jgi:hypothetical protein
MDNATALPDEKLAAESTHPELIGMQNRHIPMKTLGDWLQ